METPTETPPSHYSRYVADIKDLELEDPEPSIWASREWKPRRLDPIDGSDGRRELTGLNESAHALLEEHTLDAFIEAYPEGTFPEDMGTTSKRANARRFLEPVLSAWNAEISIPYRPGRQLDILFQLLLQIVEEESQRVRQHQSAKVSATDSQDVDTSGHGEKAATLGTATAKNEDLQPNVVRKSQEKARPSRLQSWQAEVLSIVEDIPDVYSRTLNGPSDDVNSLFKFWRLDDLSTWTCRLADLLVDGGGHSIRYLRDQDPMHLPNVLASRIRFDMRYDDLIYVRQHAGGVLGLPEKVDLHSFDVIAAMAFERRESPIIFLVYRHSNPQADSQHRNLPPLNERGLSEQSKRRRESTPPMSEDERNASKRPRHQRSLSVTQRNPESGFSAPPKTETSVTKLEGMLKSDEKSGPTASIKHVTPEVPGPSGHNHQSPKMKFEIADTGSYPASNTVLNPILIRDSDSDSDSDLVPDSKRPARVSPYRFLDEWDSELDIYRPASKTDRGSVDNGNGNDDDKKDDDYDVLDSGNDDAEGDRTDAQEDTKHKGKPGERSKTQQRFQEIVTDVKQGSKLNEHLSDESWNRMCDVFLRGRSDMTTRIPIHCLKKPLHVHQALAIIWAMDRQDRWCGGFICDQQGLGKTVTSLALMAINAELCSMHATVRSAREAIATGRTREVIHCAEGENGPCPSQAQWSFACMCTANSPTAAWRPVYGISLVVPTLEGLVSHWRSQAESLFRRKKATNGVRMRVYIGHDNLGKKRFAEDDDRRLSKNKLAHELVPGHTPHDDTLLSQLVVVTTAKSFNTQCADPLIKAYKELHKSEPPDGGQYTRWGNVFIDELHTHKSKDVLLFTRVLSRKHVSAKHPTRAALWCLSGTPWNTSILDIAPYLGWYEQRWHARYGSRLDAEGKPTGSKSNGAIPADIAACLPGRFEQAWKEVDKAHIQLRNFIRQNSNAKAKQEHDQVTKLVGGVLNRWAQLSISRCADTKLLNGQPLAVLPPYDIKRTKLTASSAHIQTANSYVANTRDALRADLEERLKNWKQKGSKGKEPTIELGSMRLATRRARLIASIPFLAELQKRPEFGDMPFLVTTMVNEKKWHLDWDDSPFEMYRTEIVNSSPKLQWLRSILQTLSNEREAHPARDEGSLQAHHKIVIISDFVAVLAAIRQFVKADFPNLGVDMVGRWADDRDRARMYQAFNDVVDYTKQEFTFASRQRIDILLGPSQILSTGVDLPRANIIILTEPWYDRAKEAQALARIHRLGQSRRCTGFKLSTHGLQVEQLVSDRANENVYLQAIINEVKNRVDEWSSAPNPADSPIEIDD